MQGEADIIEVGGKKYIDLEEYSHLLSVMLRMRQNMTRETDRTKELVDEIHVKSQALIAEKDILHMLVKMAKDGHIDDDWHRLAGVLLHDYTREASDGVGESVGGGN